MTDLQRQQIETAQKRERAAWIAFTAAPRDIEKDKAWQEANRQMIDGITGKYPVCQFERRPDEGLLE
jgi:hypothetical protein